MSSTTDTTSPPEPDLAVADPVAAPAASRPHWIDDWRPEDPAFWETTGERDRPPQPGLLDPVRAHRLLHLEHVVGLRAVPRAGVRLRPGAEVPADDACPTAVGALHAHALHVRRGPVRRPQLDDRQRRCCCSCPACSPAIVLEPGVVVRRRCWSSPRWPASAAATSRRRWPTSTPSTRSASRAGRSASTPAAATSAWPPCSSSAWPCWPPPGADHPRLILAVYIPLIVVATAVRRAVHGQPDARHQREAGACAT